MHSGCRTSASDVPVVFSSLQDLKSDQGIDTFHLTQYPRILTLKLKMIKDWSRASRITRSYLKYLKKRFREDRILLNSGSLSFVTLLSMVPLITVVLSAFSLFPVFEKWRGEVEAFVFRIFVPNFGEEIREHLFGFVDNATKMTPVGIFVLIVVALLLISSIDRTFNHIWRIQKPRRLVVSFSIYWLVLTLGPVLIGISLFATSYLLTLMGLEESLVEMRNRYWKSLPFLSSWLFFMLLYIVVPNTRVHIWSALSGAFIAAILFELSKTAFAFYLANFPVYQAIYGALAIIPLLFIWVYVTWVVVLIGAEISASLEGYLEELKKATIFVSRHEAEEGYDEQCPEPGESTE